MIPPCLISSLPLVLFVFFSSVAFVVNAYTVEKSFLFFFFSLGQRALNLLAYCSHAHRGKRKKTRARLAFCY